ncbi:hypothetical protein GTY65_24145 [Streptomyces sp. SID8379]|uniref:hypothetical protein n=1 Tax=unclassified Streptomyces TaxID=2593676 RepID=UPI000371B618|nr:MULTISPECIES: hypothetical protein [unclassified Streptomyces]MYW67134.1 hypothetical protein [Streptomyces sp. SID8379]
MISLHEVYERGNEAVKGAVRAFGDRHGPASAANSAPDWNGAERHFTQLIEVIMAAATPAQTDIKGIIRRAENEAVQLLLALHTLPDYRCPICVKRQGREIL